MRSARLLAAAATLVVATACGEPAVDLDVPGRDPGQRLLDRAGLLGPEVARAVEALSEASGLDTVVVTYETEQASSGEASRAGHLVLDRWDADLVLVAVARPGDFTSTVVDRADPDDRQRFFGIEPADPRAVPGGLREEIVEGTIPPIAADNDWRGVFVTAATSLAAGLAVEEPTEGPTDGPTEGATAAAAGS